MSATSCALAEQTPKSDSSTFVFLSSRTAAQRGQIRLSDKRSWRGLIARGWIVVCVWQLWLSHPGAKLVMVLYHHFRIEDSLKCHVNIGGDVFDIERERSLRDSPGQNHILRLYTPNGVLYIHVKRLKNQNRKRPLWEKTLR